MKRSAHKFRLYLAGIALLIGGSFAWASTTGLNVWAEKLQSLMDDSLENLMTAVQESEELASIYDEDVTSKYLVNAGFDEDLTFQIDGTMKEAVITDRSLSDRSWAYISEDSTLYARPKSTSSQYRPDDRKLEAVNGFVGRIKGWTVESSATFPVCEWVYFGNVPYGLSTEAVPISDDVSNYLYMAETPPEFGGEDNIAGLYLRAGWGGWVTYKQEVLLPSAIYRLEYWTKNMNPNSTATPSDMTQVICQENVFQEAGGNLTASEWTKHEIEFIAADKCTIQFGIRSANSSSNANPWVLMDGVKLYKVGDAEQPNVVDCSFKFNGQDVENGSTVTIVAEEDPLFGDLECNTNPASNPSLGLMFVNQSGTAVSGSATINVTKKTMTTGNIQWCMGGICEILNGTSMSKTFSTAAWASTPIQYDCIAKGEGEMLSQLDVMVGDKTYTIYILFVNKKSILKYQNVATREVKIQIAPAQFYDVDMGYAVDPADLKLIGTESPTLFARLAPAEGAEWVEGEFTDAYSLTPYPGFWMSKEGFASSWGNSPWGFSYSNEDLYFTFYQMPNMSQVGDEYQAVVYLVNEENSKMISYDINIEFISKDSPDYLEKKGDLVYDLQYEPLMVFDRSYVTVDESFLMDALGCADISEVQMKALDKNGLLTSEYTASDEHSGTLNQGFWFNTEGEVCEWEDNDAFYITRDMGTLTSQLTLGQTKKGLPVGTSMSLRLYFIYDNKYVTTDFNIEIIEPKTLFAKNFIIVGEQTLGFQIENKADFNAIESYMDCEAVAKALGCQNEDIRFYSLADDSTLLYRKTADNQGFWYNSNNQVICYTEDGTNDEAFFIEQTDGKYNYSLIKVGIYSSHTTLGGKFHATHYLVYEDKAYLVHFNINVLPSSDENLLGDANCDGSVDVVDVTTTVDFILQKSQPTNQQFQNTDVNKDQSIDVVDLTSIVSIILGTYQPTNGTSKAPALRIQNDDALLLNGSDIELMNSRDYVAFQMDVTLADGAQLNGVQLSKRAENHNVTFHRLYGNTYRILAYSLNNTPFTGNAGTLLSLYIAGDQELTFSDIVFTNGVEAYALQHDIATGINKPAFDKSNAAIYDLNGRRVKSMKKDGIYVINDKKVSVR